MSDFSGKVEIEYVDKTPKGEKLDKVAKVTATGFKNMMRSAFRYALLFAIISPPIAFAVFFAGGNEYDLGFRHSSSDNNLQIMASYLGITLLGALGGLPMGILIHFIKWVFREPGGEP